MFGFGKPKTPLFTLEVAVVGTVYACNLVRNKMRTDIALKTKNGSKAILTPFVYEGKQAFFVCNSKKQDLGVLPSGVAEYLACAVKDMKAEGLFSEIAPGNVKVVLTVYGSYVRDFDIYDGTPGPKGKEYTYNLDNPEGTLFYYPVGQELPANIKELDNGYMVFVDNTPVGSILDNRAEKLKGMIDKYDCTFTVKCEPKDYGSRLQMVLRF